LSVRMYALAKELKLDNNDLVEICNKAGIQGKGSALASLTEDEVAKVKQYLSGGAAASRGRASGGVATKRRAEAPSRPVRVQPPIRHDEFAASRSGGSAKVPVLGRRKKSAEEPTSPAPAETSAESEAPTTAEPSQQPAGSPTAESSAAPPAAEAPASEAPAGAGEPSAEATPSKDLRPTPQRPKQQESAPLRDIRRSRKRGEDKGQDQDKDRSGDAKSKKPARPEPGIHLAPVPLSKQPQPKPKSDEPAPQKPEVRLPPDAIRAATKPGGARPLAAHLKRTEDKVRSEQEPKPEDTKRARGKPRRGKAETEDRPMLGGREQRQLNRTRRATKRVPSDFTDEGGSGRRRPRRQRRAAVSTAAPRKGKVTITLPCTVRSFSEATGAPAKDVLRILLSEGTMATITAQLDPEMAELIAEELGMEVEFRHAQSLEDKLLTAIRERQDAPEDLVGRPPVVTFLGHVDHGKTSLLDKIIGIDVVSGESGGITQHIRAYQIQKDEQKIAFVDTPGHEAFTEMRARGANVTDIAVLVVAADDGVMPQTEEAISHARAAEVPIVVALNKIDLPGVDVNRAMQQLSANDLLPSEWGGDVEVVKTSATTGEGVDELLETLLTVAELHEYQANPQRPAYGTCLESQQDVHRGVVSKMIVQSGTLHVGDVIVCGEAFGRVKAMFDTLKPRRKAKSAGPSTPVNLTGLDIAPNAGEHFYVLEDIAQAREIASERAEQNRSLSLSGTQAHVTLENLYDRLGAVDEVATLNLIIRADVRGSLEAIEKELGKLDHDEVRIKVLQSTVGGISEADVHLADASDAIIIGFNVVPDERARSLADDRGVQIRRYDIIYKLTEDIKAALEGLLKPEEREVELGRALVQRVFTISRVGSIAGCRVLAGTIERDTRARLIRNNTIIGDYPIGSLRREKDDIKQVREGMECGIKLAGFNDVKEADIIECYKIEEVGRTLD